MTRQPSRLSPLRCLFLMVAVCGIALTTVATVAAQGGRGGFNRGGPGGQNGGFQRAAYSVQHLDVIDETLALDEGQKEIVRVFLDSYSSRFTEINAAMQDEMEFVREEMRNASRDDNFDRGEAFEQMRKQREQFDSQREQAAAEFVAGLQSVLSDDQMQRWPQFERTMRRIQLVPRGTLSGENVDLFNIVKNTGISDESQNAVRPMLEEYEQYLDAALQQRESELSRNDGGRGGFFRAIATGETDVDDVIDDAKRRTKLRVRVRNLNEQYAQQIEAMLVDPAEASAFHDTFRVAAYPRVWNETWGQQVFNAALAFELDQNIVASIEQLATLYFDGLDQRNQKLQRVVRAEEPGQTEQRIEMMAARMNGEDVDRPEDLMREAFSSRSEFEQDMVAKLREYLTEDNLRALPRRPDPRNRSQGRGDRGGFGGGRGPGGGGGDRGGFGGGRRGPGGGGGDRGGGRGT